MELRESKRKRRSNLTPQSPFPVPIESITGIPSSLAVRKVCVGKYNGDSVVVNDSEDIFKLHHQGFYGKGSLSRSFPDFGRIVRGIPPFIRKRQWDLRCSWDRLKNVNDQKKRSSNHSQEDEAEKSVGCLNYIGSIGDKPDCSISSAKQTERNGHPGWPSENNSVVINEQKTREEHKTEHISKEQEHSVTNVRNIINKSVENDVLVTSLPRPILPSINEVLQQENTVVVILPDSDDDDVDEENFLANIKPELKTEPFSIHESLHLTLEESFFLSYALGCLQVLDLSGNNLSLTNIWQLFCDSQNDFVQLYVAYHYFRAKNWVVKPGVKFGGDFVLYKQGPPFYHALYIVKVEVIDERTKDRVGKPSHQALNWTRLMGLHRLAETAGKEILLCQVVWPANLPENALRSPKVLSKFTVHEMLLRRWVSSKERENEFEDF